VLAPFRSSRRCGGKKFAIVMITERRGDGEITYRTCVTACDRSSPRTSRCREYLAQLRRATYVEVRAS
jgi:hypothetical protein